MPKIANGQINDQQKTILKSLMRAGAVSAGQAIPLDQVAERANLSRRLAYHYCWKEGVLCTKKYIAQAQVEGTRGHCYYLRAKGKKIAS